MKNSARQPSIEACGALVPPMIDVALRVARSRFEVPWTPAQELAAEVGHQDRQLMVQRRDLVLEVNRIALVGPEEDLEHVLVPQVHEILAHGRGERAVGSLHQKVEPGRRVQDLEARIVGVAVGLATIEARSIRSAAKRGDRPGQ